MKKTILICAFLICAIAVARGVRAEQPEDGRISIYRQLLGQANDSIAMLGAQLQAAQAENARLAAELAKPKPEPEKKP
jgi:hypothetical protein